MGVLKYRIKHIVQSNQSNKRIALSLEIIKYIVGTYTCQRKRLNFRILF